MAPQWFVVPSAGAIGGGQQHNHAVAESESHDSIFDAYRKD
jgi:hypothetical protein